MATRVLQPTCASRSIQAGTKAGRGCEDAGSTMAMAARRDRKHSGRERDRRQQAEDAAQLGTDRDGHEHEGRIDAHRVCVDDGPDEHAQDDRPHGHGEQQDESRPRTQAWPG